MLVEEALRRENAKLKEQAANLERQIEELCKQLSVATRDNQALMSRLKELLRRRSTLKAEAPGQLDLAFEEQKPIETPPESKEAPDGETPEDSIKRRHRPKRPARELNWDALPREHVYHELSEDERVCPETGIELVAIGEEVTESIDYRPAKLVVVEHHRTVYGLAPEDAADRQVKPLVTPMPPRPLEALVGAGLLAWIIVQKYRHHLPLYRQESVFGREGLQIPRQTMCDWLMRCAEELGPIQRAMRRELLSCEVLGCDDTPILCQGRKGTGKFQAHLVDLYQSTCEEHRVRLLRGLGAREREGVPRRPRGVPCWRWLQGIPDSGPQLEGKDRRGGMLEPRAEKVPR